jgi:hypothetical protein|tara:strand:- start:15496 stop:16047 length:552 start_codon:yes stop_codon:yes gene_type:complete
MPSPPDEKVLERYLKVRTLWERTEGNEKANAARVMAALQSNYPGIDQYAQSSASKPKVEQMADPTWTQAMADAVGILAGFTSPFDVLNRYAPFIDAAGQPSVPQLQTPDEAVKFLSQFARVGVRDSVRGLRVQLDLDPETASILDDYLASRPSDEAVAKLAHRAGEMIGRRFFTLLKEWRDDP